MNQPVPSLPKQKPYSLSKSRRTMQWGFLAITLLIGIRHIMPERGGRGGSFDAFCPFGGIETLLPYLANGQTLRSTNLLNFSVLLGVIGTAFLAGRAFCGWMCPLGTLQDLLASWSRRLSGEEKHIRGKRSRALLPLRLPQSLDRPLRYVKYMVLLLVIIASLFTAFPPLHSFCAVRALFSFKLTPLLIASGTIFLLISVLVKRSFCKYFCPMGAFLALSNKISPIRLISEPKRCNNCGRCDIECSMGIEDVPDHNRSSECIRCMECLETCARDGSLHIRFG